MDIQQKPNVRILNFLTTSVGYKSVKEDSAPVFATWNSVADPYRGCGSHPEVVERLWDHIGRVFPLDCRGLVYGNPSLIHGKTGIIFAVGFGTCYILRLPGSIGSQAIDLGSQTRMKFSTGLQLDIRLILGDEWVFGDFQQNELVWCKEAYEAYK